MTDVMKWAFVGDLQIPYEDERAVALWFKVMKWWKPDAIDIVGDIDDQLEYSRFSDGTTDEFFNQLKRDKVLNEKLQAEKQRVLEKAEKNPEIADEVWVAEQLRLLAEQWKNPDPLPFVKKNADGARKFYEKVRKQHPNADIHASLGNHDVRVFDYLDKKAPDSIGEVTPEFLWGLDNVGITWRWYKEEPFERFAGIHVHHGATTTDTGLAVKGDIEKYGISLVRGHDHRGGVVYKSYPLSHKGSLAGMGTGHLCDTSSYGMEYTFNHAWEKGFGIAHVVNDKAHLHFVPMRDYTCVVDGKVFTG